MASRDRDDDDDRGRDDDDRPSRGGRRDDDDIPVFKQNPILVLVLGLLTCGLYLIYWNMQVAKVLNAVTGKETLSPPIAILGGCCLPVGIYFWYLIGQQPLTELGRMTGQDLKGKAMLLLILAIFFPYVSAMILQGHINEIYDR